jgi:hypothetical protein
VRRLLYLLELKIILTVPMMLVRVAIQHHPHGLTFLKFEFAFEIGSGLPTEVRRLQDLLAERDKVIQNMKEEKEGLEKSLEGLRGGF